MVFALETFWPCSDGWRAARIEEEIVVTPTGHEVITRFPAEKLLVAGATYVTVDGPLSTTREDESTPNREVVQHDRRGGTKREGGGVGRDGAQRRHARARDGAGNREGRRRGGSRRASRSRKASRCSRSRPTRRSSRSRRSATAFLPRSPRATATSFRSARRSRGCLRQGSLSLRPSKTGADRPAHGHCTGAPPRPPPSASHLERNQRLPASCLRRRDGSPRSMAWIRRRFGELVPAAKFSPTISSQLRKPQEPPTPREPLEPWEP